MIALTEEKEVEEVISLRLAKPDIERLTKQMVVDMQLVGDNIRFYLANGVTVTIPNWK